MLSWRSLNRGLRTLASMRVGAGDANVDPDTPVVVKLPDGREVYARTAMLQPSIGGTVSVVIDTRDMA